MDMFLKEDSQLKFSTTLGNKPLPDRMRPESLELFFGQENIVGSEKLISKAIIADNIPSLVLWGPPGCGKTTLAEIIARKTKGQFVRFSAVTSRIKEVKALLSSAKNYFQLSGRRTFVFVDEIHRFNKAQQDAFLPYVENGDIILIGATTQNPSFEINSALLSRMQVILFERLSEDALLKILNTAVSDEQRGLGQKNLNIEKGALEFISQVSDGDARRALSLLESSVNYIGDRIDLNLEDVKEAFQSNAGLYDKSGEEHFNIISALHKSIRGSDPDASLYWLARMLVNGEDPMYVLRRLIRFASEDIGLADPFALTVTLNARDSFHFLGSPEGELAIAQAVIYLACAPKSNSAYVAYKQAVSDAREKGSLPVPLWIRNAPTKMMKDFGYGDGYKYAHDFEDAVVDQEYFPERLKGREYYSPQNRGREIKISEQLKTFRELRAKLKLEK